MLGAQDRVGGKLLRLVQLARQVVDLFQVVVVDEQVFHFGLAVNGDEVREESRVGN